MPCWDRPALLAMLLLMMVPQASLAWRERIPDGIVKLWAAAFGGEIKAMASRYSGWSVMHKKYQRLEKGLHIDTVDGLQLVRRVARDMEAMFSKKVEAVKRLVITAEEAELQHHYDENLEYQYHNAVEQSQEHDTYGTEFDIEPNEHFGNLSVNMSLSSVQVPTNIYNQDPAIINGAFWSTALNPVFIKNLEKDPTLTWQYFGSMDGFFRQFPAIRWDMEINSERGVIEYDCRNRGWYIQASTSAKDVILLVDVSGSMKGLRMTIAKRMVTSILDTLGDNDFFNIIAYNDEVHYVESCLNGTLVQADRDTREHFKNLVGELYAKGTGMLGVALTEAFNTLNEFNMSGQGSQCSQVIMLITDGAAEAYKDIFQRFNRPDKRVRMFTFLIGQEETFADSVKWMACTNMGFYSQVSTLANIPENIMPYLAVLSRPMAISRQHMVIWTEAYIDNMLPQTEKMLSFDSQDNFFKTTVAMPVFSGKNETKIRGVLLGVVGLDVPIKDILRVVPLYKLGGHGYAFLLTNNGYILTHPELRPLYKEDGKTKVKPHSVDLSEVEWGPHSEMLRTAMVNRDTGTFTMAKHNIIDEQQKEMSQIRHYYYTSIRETPFSLAIVLTGGHGKNTFSTNVSVEKGLRDLLHPSLSLSEEWAYCHTEMDPHLHKLPQHEAIRRYLSGKKLGLRCDDQLIRQVLFDVSTTAPLEDYWNALINNKTHILEPGVERAFLGTRSGLTRQAVFVQPHTLTDQDFLTESQRSTIFTLGRFPVWFHRAAEANPGTFIHSLPWDTGPKNKSSVVTISSSITVSNNRKTAIAAVVGIQMKLDFYRQKFWTATRQCNTLGGNCPINIEDETLSCYLIDWHGLIFVSKNYDQTGLFLGEIDGIVMTKLVTLGIFQRVTMYDYQAMCQAEESENSSSNIILSPYRAAVTLIRWILAELAMFLLEFNFRVSWSYEHIVSAQRPKRQDKLQPCHKQYPTFWAELSMQETTGSIDCGDCERQFVVQKVPDSNLLLLLVDTRCPCDQVPHLLLKQTEIRHIL
uniref:Calcium channel, voltage dependent, alpha2/delta subunit 3 n=1 Tax=Eptatretus burgeri TaxID=7764 RepID=A0A8C4NJ64_EPTBU